MAHDTELTVGGWVLDLAPVTDLAEGLMIGLAMLDIARKRGITLLVPVTVLARVYHEHPEPAARQRLAMIRDEQALFLLSMLEEIPGPELLRLLTRTDGDETAAQVAWAAAGRGWPAVTDRPEILTRADPAVRTMVI